jgi:hypothetical protein
MPTKDLLLEEAVLLRKIGWSYSEIQKQIPRSISTLSLWLNHIKLTEKQKQRLLDKTIPNRVLGSKSLREARIKKAKIIVDNARNRIGNITRKELWLIGSVLYWAEGSKQKEHDPSKQVIFSNSDPTMIKVFLKWLEKPLGIPRDRIVFEIYIHETYQKSKRALATYWSRATGFPTSRFGTVYYKKNKVHSYRKNRGANYHGVLRITVVKSTDLNREITGWISGICGRLGISDIIPID